MHSHRFLIFEEKQKLFFSRKAMYGYNFQNQIVYKAIFSDSINEARQFRSVASANKLLDSLPPTDTFIHLLVSQENLPIRLANLVVMPITINYDS